jgi:hypothetical protein
MHGNTLEQVSKITRADLLVFLQTYVQQYKTLPVGEPCPRLLVLLANISRTVRDYCVIEVLGILERVRETV